MKNMIHYDNQIYRKIDKLRGPVVSKLNESLLITNHFRVSIVLNLTVRLHYVL